MRERVTYPCRDAVAAEKENCMPPGFSQTSNMSLLGLLDLVVVREEGRRVEREGGARVCGVSVCANRVR
jgi:hypothetical protein